MARDNNKHTSWRNSLFSLFNSSSDRNSEQRNVQIYVVNGKNYDGVGEYIGRGTPLGNPFKITSTQDRITSLHRYQKYILNALKLRAPHQKDEIMRLLKILIHQGKLTLVCHCAPLPCHGDIIKSILEKMIHNHYKGKK